MVEKRNPDYAGSAVMLTNPPQVEQLLMQLHKEEILLNDLQKEAGALIPQNLKDNIKLAQDTVGSLDKALRQAIDELGSFQDPDRGQYALKQRRESILYKPDLVRQYAPSKVASFVIIESVDSKALDALVKVGQVDAVTARQCGEVKESYAYIIKSMNHG